LDPITLEEEEEVDVVDADRRVGTRGIVVRLIVKTWKVDMRVIDRAAIILSTKYTPTKGKSMSFREKVRQHFHPKNQALDIVIV
jgi:hypothetical protein